MQPHANLDVPADAKTLVLVDVMVARDVADALHLVVLDAQEVVQEDALDAMEAKARVHAAINVVQVVPAVLVVVMVDALRVAVNVRVAQMDVAQNVLAHVMAHALLLI